MIDLSTLDLEPVFLWLAKTGLNILIIVILAIVSYGLLLFALRHLTGHIKGLDEVEESEQDKRVETISRLVKTTGLVVIIVVALLMILGELGIDIGPILASVGIVSLSIGLGAQTLVKDVIGGLFIILEGQFQVGDVVELQGRIGTVEDMTLRATQIRDVDGSLHIVPNGEIRIVTNRTRGWSRAVVDVGISYEDDIELAKQALSEIGEAAVKDPVIGPLLLEQPAATGVEGLDDWQVRLRIVAKTKPNEQWAVQRYLRQQIHEVFPAKGISLASPRQEVVVVQPEH
jgi:small conductance mechanosensitive channel